MTINFLEEFLRAFGKSSKHFPFGDHSINSRNHFTHYVVVLSGLTFLRLPYNIFLSQYYDMDAWGGHLKRSIGPPVVSFMSHKSRVTEDLPINKFVILNNKVNTLQADLTDFLTYLATSTYRFCSQGIWWKSNRRETQSNVRQYEFYYEQNNTLSATYFSEVNNNCSFNKCP